MAEWKTGEGWAGWKESEWRAGVSVGGSLWFWAGGEADAEWTWKVDEVFASGAFIFDHGWQVGNSGDGMYAAQQSVTALYKKRRKAERWTEIVRERK